MRVLVACEFSGIVRDAFGAAGHTSASCDLLPSEKPGWHYQQDILEVLASRKFDLIIAHPPCTYLTVSGNRWYAGSRKRRESVEWTARLWDAMTEASPHLVLENPVGVLSRHWRKPDQTIQPWQFGHAESKRTCLWLENLPLLEPTHEKPEEISERVWRMPPSPERQRERSRFFEGIARAMAEQWTSVALYRERRRKRSK